MSDPAAPVRVEIKDQVMVLTINRPQDENGMDCAAYEQMCDAYEQANASPEIRVIVLTGDDHYFMTGGRVNSKDPEEKRRYEAALRRRERLQGELRVPIVAAVSGDCRAGGMGFVADADFAVARQGVRFGFTEAKHGTFPCVVMARTVHMMPKKKALEAFYSGEMFSAEEALAMGFLNCVVPAQEFWPTVWRYVGYILAIKKEIFTLGREGYYAMAAMADREARTAYANDMLPKLLSEVAKNKDATIKH